jgi:hypothetical protein
MRRSGLKFEVCIQVPVHWCRWNVRSGDTATHATVALRPSPPSPSSRGQSCEEGASCRSPCLECMATATRPRKGPEFDLILLGVCTRSDVYLKLVIRQIVASGHDASPKPNTNWTLLS